MVLRVPFMGCADDASVIRARPLLLIVSGLGSSVRTGDGSVLAAAV